MALRGHHTDNGATCLSIGGIIVAVPVVGIVRELRRQTGAMFAALFGFFSPLLVFAAIAIV